MAPRLTVSRFDNLPTEEIVRLEWQARIHADEMEEALRDRFRQEHAALLGTVRRVMAGRYAGRFMMVRAVKVSDWRNRAVRHAVCEGPLRMPRSFSREWSLRPVDVIPAHLSKAVATP